MVNIGYHTEGALSTPGTLTLSLTLSEPGPVLVLVLLMMVIDDIDMALDK